MSKETYVIRKCILGRQLDDLDGEHRDKLNALLDKTTENGGLPIKTVAVQLKRIGFRASAGGVSEHRAKVCMCYIDGAL